MWRLGGISPDGCNDRAVYVYFAIAAVIALSLGALVYQLSLTLQIIEDSEDLRLLNRVFSKIIMLEAVTDHMSYLMTACILNTPGCDYDALILLNPMRIDILRNSIFSDPLRTHLDKHEPTRLLLAQLDSRWFTSLEALQVDIEIHNVTLESMRKSNPARIHCPELEDIGRCSLDGVAQLSLSADTLAETVDNTFQKNATKIRISVYLTCGTAILGVIAIIFAGYKVRIWAESAANANMRAFEQVMKMMSHDFKGSVLNVQAQATILEGSAVLCAELEHVVHSICSIKYRMEIASGVFSGADARAQPLESDLVSASLKPILFTLALMFPTASFPSMDTPLDIHLLMVPCLLHLALHQIIRNAHVHGGGKVEISVVEDKGRCTISVFNPPGQFHQQMLDAGPNALELANSGSVSAVSSSGLGLTDIRSICESQPEVEFSISWRPEGVYAEIVTLVKHKSPIETCSYTSSQSIRVCVIDDQLGPRMMTPKLLRLLNPKIEYTPPKMRKLKAVYQDEHCKTGGLTMSQIEDCVAWVNEEPLRTVCFLDRLLEIDDRVLDGLTLIPALTLKGALVIVFSGNDSDEDHKLYLSKGVH